MRVKENKGQGGGHRLIAVCVYVFMGTCVYVCVRRANGLSSLGNAPVSSLTYGNHSLNAGSHYKTHLHKDSFK